MAFHITHRCGVMESNPPLAALRLLLHELHDRPEDKEHCSVSVTHESEWCLAALGDGHIVWEHVEGDAPSHLTDVSDDKLLHLWKALAEGDIEFIKREPWLPGY